MMPVLALKMLVSWVVGDRDVLRRQIGQRSRHQRHLAVDRDAGRELDRAEKQHQHQRYDHGEFDGGQPLVSPDRSRAERRMRSQILLIRLIALPILS